MSLFPWPPARGPPVPLHTCGSTPTWSPLHSSPRRPCTAHTDRVLLALQTWASHPCPLFRGFSLLQAQACDVPLCPPATEPTLLAVPSSPRVVLHRGVGPHNLPSRHTGSRPG